MLQFPPFAGALDVGRARPCAPHDAIPPFAGSEDAVRGGEAAVRGGEAAVRGGEAAVRGGEVAVRGGEVAVRGGEAPASPTPAAINADNGALQLRRPASWTERRLASRAARTVTLRCEREPAIACANRQYRT